MTGNSPDMMRQRRAPVSLAAFCKTVIPWKSWLTALIKAEPHCMFNDSYTTPKRLGLLNFFGENQDKRTHVQKVVLEPEQQNNYDPSQENS